MPNALGNVPKGSLLQAQNVVVDYNGLLSVRRGIKQFGTSLAALISNANAIIFQEFFYKNSKLVWFGDSTVGPTSPFKTYLAYDSDGLGTWVQTTNPFPPPAYSLTLKYRSVQVNNNLYITTAKGIYKTDAPANPLKPAGSPPGLDGSAALADVAGFMSTNTQVAYRLTWIITDANKNAGEGAPSTRVIIANTSGGTRNVQLTFTIPKTVTTTSQWVIYRSIMSASSSTVPSDELQQVATGFPSSTDITNGFFTVKDSLIQSQLGTALYTNSGQQGIAQANAIPPLANDVCFFFGYTIYGAATTQQKFLLSLLSADGAAGIQIGDTFTITNGASNFTLTGAAAENIGLGQFQVTSGGDPATDITLTKQSLIHVLNRYAQTLVYAFDSSNSGTNVTALPGDFFIQEQGIGGGVFGVSSSRSTCWTPALTSSTTANVSAPGGSIGQGYCSKYQQPEAVPLSNTISVGNPNFEWFRCLPLRNSVMILKADGLFQLTGTTFPFQVTTLDTGTILSAPESAVVMNNQVFAYTNQGVVSISETGPGIISRPIENLLRPIASTVIFPNFPALTFGTGYKTDRKYILSTIANVDLPTQATIQYVYDTITETWTTYLYPVAVNDIFESPTERILYVASASTAYPYLFQERKTYTRVDFADIELPVAITGVSGTSVTVTSSANAQVGWSLVQFLPGSTQLKNLSVITAVPNSTHITVTDVLGWDTTGTLKTAVEQPIAVAVRYAPITGVGASAGIPGNPGTIKMWQEAQFFFQNIQFSSVNVGFSTDFVGPTSQIALVPVSSSAGWGQFGWGSAVWGGTDQFAVASVRTYVPLPSRRARWLNISLSLNQAMVGFTYDGCVIIYKDASLRSL